MIFLTEVADIEEFYRLRLLFEVNGILIYLGNQDSARNFGVFHPVGKYAIHIMLEDQFDDAQKLLFDASHIVEKKVDVEEYQQYFEQNKALVNEKILFGLLIILSVLIISFAVFVF